MKIEKPICPDCGDKDVRIMQVSAPGYYEIIVLFACFTCKYKFIRIIEMEDKICPRNLQ